MNLDTVSPSQPRILWALDRLNPLTRLGIAIAISIPLLISLDYVTSSIILIFMMVAFRLCGLSTLILIKRCAILLMVAPIGAISMALYGTVGGRIWWQWSLITISDRSLELALAVMMRIMALGMSAIVLIASSDATRMADALGQILRLPSRFVLGVLAGSRLFSVFLHDWVMLRHARRARGLEARGIRYAFSMIFSLLVFAIRRGIKLATAMESRAFGCDKQRTWARPSTMGKADLIATIITIILIVLSVSISMSTGHFSTVIG